MESTVTVETITLWQIIRFSGIFGVIVIPASTLLLCGSVIGLIFNRSKFLFYQWMLGIIIRLNLLAGALILTSGIHKLWMTVSHLSDLRSVEILVIIFEELMGGIYILLLIAFVAFLIKTITEIRQKLNAPIKK